MPTVDYLPFAAAVDADVMTQADYLAAAFRTSGFQNGIAVAEQLNKVWRQSAFVSAALANFVSQQTGLDVLDDGDLNALIAQIASAVVIGAGVKPCRVVSSSANMDILLTDYRVAFARVAAPAALTATLPAGATVGQSFRVGDVQGNMNAYPVTVVPPSGSIAQRANYVINVDRQWVEFAYVDTDLWSVEF